MFPHIAHPHLVFGFLKFLFSHLSFACFVLFFFVSFSFHQINLLNIYYLDDGRMLSFCLVYYELFVLGHVKIKQKLMGFV